VNRKKLLILVSLLVGIIIISILLYNTSSKKDDIDTTGNKAGLNSSDENSQDTEEYEEQVQKELVINGNSEKEAEEINEFIPDKDSEEIKETLDQEISQEQEEVIDSAIKDNSFELHNQTAFEVSLNDKNLVSVQEALNSQLQVVFNEFLVDAQLGKYEYEKIGAMVATYANNLQKDIKESGQFTEDELTVISASITKKLLDLDNQLYPYLGNSKVKSEEELTSSGIDTSTEHPYQDIINGTVEDAQSTQESLQEEIIKVGGGKVEIPEGATEYKPPEIHIYDESGNEVDKVKLPWE